MAYYTVELWEVKHTHYAIPIVPSFSLTLLLWIILLVFFGLAAMLFPEVPIGAHFQKAIPYPPLRPLVAVF
jgi:hypothetical protein